MLQNFIVILIAILSFLLVGSKTNTSNYPKVSVVIPAFNEEKTIEHVINTVKKVSTITQIIVVDDGSTDNTANIVSKIDDVILLSHTSNKGKGSAMKTGLKKVTGQIVLFLDADLSQINPSQVEAIIQPILDDEADITKTKFKREAGRVTELTAKPLLNFFFPELSFEQPLSGQFAAIKSFLDKIDLEKDYGVDIGIVLDADALGMRIQEVDIGNIVHQMSTLKELNLMANEVVRTIVDRAINYGRLTMVDDLGNAIRMEILSLSITTFGIFSLFFIKYITSYIAVIILGIGVLLSLYYIIRIIRMSIRIYRQSKIGPLQMFKSFIRMHFPVIISIIILLAIVTSLVGSVNISSNEISLEPVTKNLVISTSNSSSGSVDVRGPYTIESALENEEQLIRLPNAALNTLQSQYGDIIYIDGESYQLEQSVNNENGIIRMPEAAREKLDVQTGNVIRDSDLRELFEGTYFVHNIQLDDEHLNDTGNSTLNPENVNVSISQKLNLKPSHAKVLSVFVNDTLVAQKNGVITDDYYTIYLDNVSARTLYLNESSVGNIYNTTYLNSDIIIKLEDTDSDTTNKFVSDNDSLRFINILFS